MEHNGKQDSGKERFFMLPEGENVSAEGETVPLGSEAVKVKGETVLPGGENVPVKGETVTAEEAEAATGAGREQFCMRRWAKMRFGGQRGAWKCFGALGGALMIIAAAGAAVYTAGYTDWNEPALNAEKILAQSKLGGRTFKGEVQEVSALGGKVRAYLMEEHSVPLAAVSFGFAKAGRAYEPKPGAALLAESVLSDGAGRFDRRELRDLMKEKGIKLSVTATADRLEFSLSFVKQFEKEALEVLRAVMYEPHLKREDIELARRQLAVLRQQRRENPQQQLGELVRTEFYGSHPYGREDIPDEKALAAVTAEDIRAYLRSFMGKDNLAAGISGDMDKAEAEAFLAQAFGGLTDKAAGAALPAFAPDFRQEAAVRESDVSAQSFVLALAPGVARLDKDFYPLYVANHIFGGAGLSSRLSRAVREKEGLTYGIYSYFSNSDAGDLWQVYFSATPENTSRIMTLTAEEYGAFYRDGVGDEEVELAQKSLMSSFNLRFASLLDIADMLEQMQVQALGADFLKTRQAQVAAVTVEAVNDAVRRRMPKSFAAGAGMRVFEVSGALGK